MLEPNNGFFKTKRSQELLDILKTRLTAYGLLSLIAFRARRTNEKSLDGLEVGQAYVGDYENYGVTEQIYRTDKKFLEKYKFSTFKSTPKGTIATLCPNNIFDINPTNKLTNKLTDSQRTPNEQLTTNKNVKNERMKEIYIYISKFNELFGTKYEITTGRETKLSVRLQKFSIEQILQALENLSQSKFHKGENDRHWVADPDFLIRSDEQVDKWLNSKRTKLVSKSDNPTMDALDALKRSKNA